MRSHYAVQSSHKLSADKNSRNRWAPAQQPEQGFLNLLTAVLLVEFVDSRIDSQPTEEPLDNMAHAARTYTENHHGALGGQLMDSFHRRHEAAGGRTRLARQMQRRSLTIGAFAELIIGPSVILHIV